MSYSRRYKIVLKMFYFLGAFLHNSPKAYNIPYKLLLIFLCIAFELYFEIYLAPSYDCMVVIGQYNAGFNAHCRYDLQ